MEKITKYRCNIVKDGKIIYCKSFYSLADAKKHYKEDLKDKYPLDKYIVYYSSYVTCE